MLARYWAAATESQVANATGRDNVGFRPGRSSLYRAPGNHAGAPKGDHDMADYMLLLHQDLDRKLPSNPDAIVAMTREYMDWADRMRTEGRLKGGQKLMDDPGRVLHAKNGKVSVTDGPYAESKEVLGGYYIITAADYAEACRLAEGTPHLKFGGRVEVREIHPM